MGDHRTANLPRETEGTAEAASGTNSADSTVRQITESEWCVRDPHARASGHAAQAAHSSGGETAVWDQRSEWTAQRGKRQLYDPETWRSAAAITPPC
jgi:hypothetical protein